MNNEPKQMDNNWRNPDGTLKSGHPSFNNVGRPKGVEDFKTVWFRALEKIAKDKKSTAEQVEQEIIAKLFEGAENGDYRFIKDVLDRRFGKAPETIDMSVDGYVPNIIGVRIVKDND